MYLQHFKCSWASSSIVWSVILISSAFSLLIFTAFAWNNVLQLPVFFLLFLLSSGITDFENHLICWIEAVFPKYSCKIWWKNWYFHSHIKTYDHQIWQAVTYRPVDSSGTNQTSAGYVITAKLRNKLKTYLHYQSAYVHKTWSNSNLPWWAHPPHKVTWTFDHVVLRDRMTN